MNTLKSLFFLSIIILSSACIGDDFVNDTIEPQIRFTSLIDTLGFNDMYQFEYIFLNNVGEIEDVAAIYSSSNIDVIPITEDGLASGLEAGESFISISYSTDDLNVRDSILVVVGENTVSSNQSTSGQIITTSSYQLEGDFEFIETQSGVTLSIADNYRASTALPGLYVYLSNNKNSIANALEIGPVEVFSGAHEYQIDNVSFDQFSYIVYFCKPFNVKVGDASL